LSTTIDLLASEYGWSIDHILDLRTRQVVRLVEVLSDRLFQDSMTGAQLQEVAISRALAGAFSKTNLPPWPTERRSDVDKQIEGPMKRLREKALE